MAAALISLAYEDGRALALARYKDIIFLVYFHIVFRKYGDVAVVCCFANAHE